MNLSPYGYQGSHYLLSAAHNVLDDNGAPFSTVKIELESADRTVWSKCRVLAFDKELDLCLLESNDPVPVLAELADEDSEVGAETILAGSPRGIPVKLFDGKLTKRFDSGSIRTSVRIPFDHGDSGGPFVASDSGKVIGVAVAGVPKDGDLDHEIGLFVPVAAVRSFLERQRKGGTRETLVATVARHETKQTPPPQEFAKTLQVLAPQAQVKGPALAASEAPPPPSAEKVAVASRTEAPAAPPVPAAPVLKANMPPVVELASAEERATLAAPKAPAPVKEAVPAVYVVQEGDNLTKIARRFKVALNDLIAANNIRNPNVIVVGAQMRLP
ncbi:MAG: LysM peptidoglycan-binding domain-containing protein [Planctomycetes bacterium]|nr:LysM peptidoglycan-binding domain-containing protein [Planctomycetota bacterium]